MNFQTNLYRQGLDAASHSETMSIPLKITLESLRLWIEDPGNKWGEWNLYRLGENDLDMSAPCYVTVPSSQNKCNAYVAEVIFLATGITFQGYMRPSKHQENIFHIKQDIGAIQRKPFHILLL